MGMHRRVDAEAIIADRAAGMSIAAIAMKHNCARSTVSGYVNQKDSAQAEGANGKTPANGARGTEATDNGQHARVADAAREAPFENQIAALEALAASEWARLGLFDRLRLLISRGSA